MATSEPKGGGGENERRTKLRVLRLWLILPFVATAILLAPLALVKKDAEVEVDLKVSRLSFVVGEGGFGGWFESLETRSLALQLFDRLEVGSATVEIETRDEGGAPTWRRIGEGGTTSITPATELAGLTLKDVTLSELEVPRGSRLTLLWDEEDPGSLTLRVDGAAASGRLVAPETLYLGCDYCAVSGLPPRYDFDSKVLRFTGAGERLVPFRGRDEGVTLALELQEGVKLAERGVPVQAELDFTRVDGRRRVSTVMAEGGRIVLQEIGDKTVEVKEGDFLVLDELEDFQIRSMAIAEGIDVALYGRAGVLRSGPAGFVADRRPSLLEWIYGRQAWLLYANALLLTGTTALSILKRLKIGGEEGLR